jgi:hypothetical protein
MKTILFCAASLFLLMGAARADTLTFQFTGNVADVFDDIFGDIAAGDPIHGSFRFDTSAPDLIPGDSTVASYRFTAPFGLDLTIGSHDFTASALLNIAIFNGSVDQYAVSANNDSGNLDFAMFLQDSSGTALNDDHLPSTVPLVDSFDLREFQFVDQTSDGLVEMDGTITSMTDPPAPVPEPSEGVLLLMVSIILGVVARRRLAHSSR